MLRYLGSHSKGIREAAMHLRQGAVVALPTETVYGLAAHALDETACHAIFEIKGRPLIDPLILHLHNPSEINPLTTCTEAQKAAVERLAKAFWPGPLTLVLPKAISVPDLVTAGLNSVALRIPAHPTTRRILEQANIPLAAPSANPFGYISPTRAEHVEASLGNRIDYLVDGGPCTCGLESTILDLTSLPQPRILRPGPIVAEALEEVLGLELIPITNSPEDEEAHERPQSAPGMLKQHYSPRTPVFLFSDLDEARVLAERETLARIFFQRPSPQPSSSDDRLDDYWLTEAGNLAEAGRNLFHLLRQLDGKHYSALAIERAPDNGLGRAINNRLERAAGS